MKVSLVYTGTTPELIELVEREVRKNIGPDPEIISSQDPTIIGEVRKAGYVTPGAAARLIGMYAAAVQQGADAILQKSSLLLVWAWLGLDLLARRRQQGHLGQDVCIQESAGQEGRA